ncbi:MAG TPA: LiaF domain-containing protein [Polyangiaceae bacterium]|jgi:hypothetical protein|nr:LiaF domain-containing protein [Polyangiaceae bacterium]
METREHDASRTSSAGPGDESGPNEEQRRFANEAFAREMFEDDDNDDEWQAKPPLTTDEDSFERGATLSGLKLAVQSQQFRGGHLTAVMSGVMLDLRDATLSPEGATINVQSALSGIDILVPPSWDVVCNVDSVWGGVNGSRVPDRRTLGGPRLTLKGMVVAGGLRVR